MSITREGRDGGDLEPGGEGGHENLRARSYFGWQGRGDRSLAEELDAALARYEERCGRQPSLALVHSRDGLGPGRQDPPVVAAPRIVKGPPTIYLYPPVPALAAGRCA